MSKSNEVHFCTTGGRYIQRRPLSFATTVSIHLSFAPHIATKMRLCVSIAARQPRVPLPSIFFFSLFTRLIVVSFSFISRYFVSSVCLLAEKKKVVVEHDLGAVRGQAGADPAGRRCVVWSAKLLRGRSQGKLNAFQEKKAKKNAFFLRPCGRLLPSHWSQVWILWWSSFVFILVFWCQGVSVFHHS